MPPAPPEPRRPDAVRAVRTELGLTPSVPTLVAALRRGHLPFLLHGRWGLPADAAPDARVLIAGSDPLRRAASDVADPFTALDDQPQLTGEAPDGFIGGGWVGWLGFALGRRVEPSLGPQPPRPAALPALQLSWFADVLRRDPDGRWWVEGLAPQDADPEDWIEVAAERWRRRLSAAGTPPHGRLGALGIAGGGADGHRAAVAETVQRITAGELFQANVCLRLEGELHGDAAGLVAPVLAATDPWYGAWIDAGDQRGILSASPELFLRRTGRVVRTAPIKGTAPREAGADHSDPAAAQLRDSSKDAAEHVMIVDLMRNDLGRVCDYGSIVPDVTPRLEPHAGVWHLVSHVTGRLHDGLGDGRLVRACFPPGSVTGAPKVQAQRVIAAVESTAREVYTGAHGIAGPACGLELAVTIRTLEHAGPSAWIGVGGGIVADSTPAGELAEALRKASALVAATGGELAGPLTAGADRGRPGDQQRGAEPLPARWLPSDPRRPDPAAGLLETILVTDGHPEHLARHVARLARSVRAWGLPPLPEDFAATLRARAAGSHGRRRLRIVLRAGNLPQLQVLPIGDAGGPPASLAAWIVPGGLGADKWADRTLLAALADAANGVVPLLVEADGQVLEAAHANLWWESEGALLTPPADGRLLPGIGREVLLARRRLGALECREGAATLAEIAALPLVLTSARGAQAAVLPGTPPAVAARAVSLAEQVTAALVDLPH